MTTVTGRPTLPADWAPSKAGCLRKEDYWLWFWPNKQNDNRTVLGGPSQTTDCFPPTWAASDVYVGTSCPGEYTTASCEGSDSRDTVTCCPNNHVFTCAASETEKAHGSLFPCRLKYTTERVVSATLTDFVSNTINVGEVTQKPGLHLYALGVLFVTPTPTSSDLSTSLSATETNTNTSPQTTSPSPQEPSETSTSLSPGASAGIGIGSAAGVIVIVALAWFWYRRKKAADAAKMSPHMPHHHHYMQPGEQSLGHQYRVGELGAYEAPKRQLTELPS